MNKVGKIREMKIMDMAETKEKKMKLSLLFLTDQDAQLWELFFNRLTL